MKSKLFNSLLMTAMAVAVVATSFVSCKDYDDDINDLRNQISSNATDLTSLVNEKISTLETEISNLQAQSTALEAAYEAADEALQATLEAKIATASSGAETAAEAYADIQAAQAEAAAIAAAKELVDNAVTDLQSDLDEVNALIAANSDAIAQNASDIAANADAIAQNASGISANADAISANSSAIAANAVDIAANKEAIKTLNEAVNTLDQAIKTAQARADEAYDAAQTAQSLAETNAEGLATLKTTVESYYKELKDETSGLNGSVSDLNDKISALEGSIDVINDAIDSHTQTLTSLDTAVKNLQATVASLESQVSVLQGDVAEALDQAAANKASIEKLTTELASLESTNSDAIDALNGRCDALQTLIETNQKSVEESLSDLKDTLEGDIATNLALAEAYADAAAKAVSDDLTSKIDDVTSDISAINVTLDDLTEAYKVADDEIYKYIDEVKSDLETEISNLQITLQDLISGNSDAIDQNSKDIETNTGNIEQNTKDIATNAGNIESNEKRITQLEEEYTSLKEAVETLSGTDLEELKTLIGNNETKLSDIEDSIAQINKYLVYAMKVLKSLVFAPASYVNGIAAIKFTTLQYVDWGTDYERDLSDVIEAGTEDETYTLSDNLHVEQYLGSPSNFMKESILDLAYVVNSATNYFTRSGVSDEDVPVSVVAWDVEKGGILDVTLEKNNQATSFKSVYDDEANTMQETFYTVALRATINADYIVDDEAAADSATQYVYSDWARLYETTVTPQIHNKQDFVDDNNNPDDVTEIEGKYPHFLNYSDLYYDENGDAVSSSSYVGDKTAMNEKEVLVETYDTEINLNDLVMVCDGKCNSYDLEEYGLAFEYEVVGNYLIDETCTEGGTPAADNATNECKYATVEDGVLTSTGRDAIGHTPVVRIKLVDANNTDRVIDVKYLKIKWTGELKTINPLAEFTGDYVCGGPGEGDRLFIDVDEWEQLISDSLGISAEEFQANYTLADMYPWRTYEDMKDQSSVTGLGFFNMTKKTDSEGNEISLPYWGIEPGSSIWTITEDDYKAGYKYVEAWFKFTNNNDEDTYVGMKVTLTLTITQLEMTGSRIPSYWDGDTRWMYANLVSDDSYGNGNGYMTSTYIANISNVYMTADKEAPDAPIDLVSDFAEDAYFVFDVDKLVEDTGDTQWNADEYNHDANSGHGVAQTLYYGEEPAAEIYENYETGAQRLRLYETSPRGNYQTTTDNGGVPSDAALSLVGKTVPVMLMAEWCDVTVTLEKADVLFLEPLSFNIGDSNIDAYDITTGGYSSVDIQGTVTVTEKATSDKEKNIVYSNDLSVTPYSWNGYYLYDWYGVTVSYDTENAMSDLGTGGDCDTPLSVGHYYITYDEKNCAFVFDASKGNALTKDTKVEVPVIISSKWQSDYTGVIKLTLHPAGQSAKRN